jgi:3-phytase
VDLVVASRNADRTLAVFRIDPATLRLEDVTAGPLAAGIPVYGICFYRSPYTGRSYAVVNSKPGQVRQFELRDDGSGRVVHELVRSFSLASEVEGCVADQDAGWLYIGEENAGIWRYAAEPHAPAAPVLVAATRPEGPLVADVEGLTIYYGPGSQAGYLIASSQGSDEYVVYRRAPPNAYLGRFRIVAGGGIGATEGTDGIDVTHAPLGPLFPRGVFVAQDGENDPLGQNFKLVPWERIAAAFVPPLGIDASRPLRWSTPPGDCANGVDDDGDGAADYPGDAGCRDPYSAGEAPACDDGTDNDGDGRVDFGDDPHCFSGWDASERMPAACGLGAEAGVALGALAALRRRRR